VASDLLYEYFVSAIKVCVEKFNIPEDVAGATLMALGCNGPELFTNFIAIFITHSDVGVGTIVGSEIFNLLMIVGGSIVVAPELPLELNRVTFTRDCFFYALSIVGLALALQDQVISANEALALFGCAIVFVVCVVFTKPFAVKFLNESPGAVRLQKGQVRIAVLHNNRMHDAHHIEPQTVAMSTTVSGIVCKDPTAKDQAAKVPVVRTLSNRTASQNPLLELTDISWSDIVAIHDVSGANFKLEFKGESGDPYVMNIEAVDDKAKLEYIEDISRNINTSPGAGSWIGYARNSLALVQDKKVSLASRLAHLICLPVELSLHLTIDWCDPKQPSKAHLWMAAFCMSMVWLGVFSYAMCTAADALHDAFGISTGVLGITVCAFGTSFPNFWASIIMAREGRSAMAIANALGSNVQNVFLALAVPWMCATQLPVRHGFPIVATGIFQSVLWMGGTLLVLVVFACTSGFKLTKGHGYVLMLLYVIYVIYGCETA